MVENEFFESEEIFSKSLRAGRRTYFFDVRPTKAGDYYLTITESKKYSQESGQSEYKKHKIYLYKEDFEGFKETLEECTEFIFKEKGDEVISERHVKDFKKPYADYTSDYRTEDQDQEVYSEVQQDNSLTSRFTNIEFEDI